MEASIQTPEQSKEPLMQPIPVTAEAKAILEAKDEKAQTQALLSEARNTKAMIEGFMGAVRGGRFDGGCMMDLAKGFAFLQAIHAQNKAHIDNLQERLSK